MIEWPTKETNALNALKASEIIYKGYRKGLQKRSQNYLGSANPRISSPIWFHPYQDQESWKVRMTVFYTKFKDGSYDFRYQKDVLDDFIKSYPKHTEVGP